MEIALDAERRRLIHANENRLSKYRAAATAWADMWTEIEKETSGLSLQEAHTLITRRAESILPQNINDRINPD